MESNNACLPIAAVFLYSVVRGFYLVYKIRIENVKFVPLHNLWRWVVMIIVSLVIFVPLISGVNTVEILWLPWSVLVMPPINLLQYLPELSKT